MNYTTPEEIVTYLPKEIRESESKSDLISHIIRGYRGLKVPQDKDFREKIIQIDNSNYLIPDNMRSIHSVELVEELDCPENDCHRTVPVYYTGLKNDLCIDLRRCGGDCALKYSIVDRTMRLPTSGTYRIIYNQLYSDNLEIFDDEDLKQYLSEWTIFQVDRNRSRRSDVSQNMLQLDLQLMNALYAKARGALIMRSIKLSSHKLNTNQLNYTIDEFDNRHYSTTTA